MDTSRAMLRMEQPYMWTFYVIHTREHVCTIIMHAGWLLVFYVCLSGTDSSTNLLYFYRFL